MIFLLMMMVIYIEEDVSDDGGGDTNYTSERVERMEFYPMVHLPPAYGPITPFPPSSPATTYSTYGPGGVTPDNCDIATLRA
jgi:hypothetical protein